MQRHADMHTHACAHTHTRAHTHTHTLVLSHIVWLVPYNRRAREHLLSIIQGLSGSEGSASCACGLWQLCLHNLGPCGFSAFFYVTLVTHVTPRDVRVPGLPQLITSRHRLGMSHLVQDVEAKRQVRYRSR